MRSIHKPVDFLDNWQIAAFTYHLAFAARLCIVEEEARWGAFSPREGPSPPSHQKVSHLLSACRARAQAISREGAAMSNPIFISAFSDIVDLGDDQIKEIIARVGRDDFTLALKAASEPLKERVRSSVTEEEWQAIASYMEFLGPMRLSDVELVQLQIVRKFRGAASDDQFV